MIRLGQTDDQRLVIVSNQPLNGDIARVEYYRDLKLFMLAFEGEEERTDLMPCEMSDEVAKIIHASPNIIIIVMAEEGQEAYEYIAPLVQIGL